ncbi:hypothetical protein BC833DRAFT_578554 [Globomyces pollinis-pini]|nr:hypothetical protein BC833DRAFT_578554 [Globomyces pollinis-pini]
MVVSWNAIEGKSLKFDTAEDVATYCKEIESIEGLEQIVLSGNTFGIEAAKAIAHSLKNQTEMKYIKFADMFTGRLKNEIPIALDEFVLVFEKMNKLIELDLSDNAFGPAGAKPLMRLIENNRNIQILKLNNNGLGIEGARLISLALIAAHEKNVEEGVQDNLKVIVAGRNRMESPGAGHLAKAFQAFSKSLVHIQMPQNSIRPDGISNLLNHISVCENLEFLDLQDNTFTEEGSVSLAASLPKWPNLKHLNLGDCLLGPKGGMAVIKGLTNSNTKLERIALFFNEINVLGAKLVPAMLKDKTELKSIELNGNNFEAECDEVDEIKLALEELGKSDALDELDEMEVESDVEEDEDEEVDELADALSKTKV